MNNIKYVSIMIEDNAQMPFHKYSGDAGHDLYVNESIDIAPHSTTDVHTGVRIKMPPFIFARIVGRSSTLRKHGLIINEGIIDNGFTGELFINVHNMKDEAFHVERGMRLAQIIFHRIEDVRWCIVDNISPEPYKRGDDGFGSTGV